LQINAPTLTASTPTPIALPVSTARFGIQTINKPLVDYSEILGISKLRAEASRIIQERQRRPSILDKPRSSYPRHESVAVTETLRPRLRTDLAAKGFSVVLRHLRRSLHTILRLDFP
jgi:hypothetical protein